MDKTRVVVLGSNGMLGHMVCNVLENSQDFEVIRANRTPYTGEIYFDGTRPTYLDASPHYVVNCIGILTKPSEANPELALWTNGHLPFQIASTCAKQGIKTIHISSDCVFSGKRGHYSIADTPDPTSIYGQTKLLGEVVSPTHLTIRTSVIGPEIRMRGNGGLFHWFMTQTGEIDGYTNVFWNGVTTLRLAEVIRDNLVNGPTGIIQVAGEDVSKHMLLSLISGVWNKSVNLRPKGGDLLDRTLVASDGFYQGEILPQLKELYTFMKDRQYEYELQYGKEW